MLTVALHAETVEQAPLPLVGVAVVLVVEDGPEQRQVEAGGLVDVEEVELAEVELEPADVELPPDVVLETEEEDLVVVLEDVRWWWS